MTFDQKGRPALPPQTPVLRIEAHQHSATIKRFDCDSAERLLATGSDDKTVRLWSIPDARLLHILRPPIDEGDEGKIFAVAVAPDGGLVAAGGWTGATWDRTFCVYLFDTATGKLVRRLTGLENTILHLCFSPDGRFLAGTLGGGSGARVWRVADWQLVLADRTYGADSYGAAFDRQNSLVTTCYDGEVRLYTSFTKAPVKASVRDCRQPFGIAFAPDGDRIAVGYADRPVVRVLGPGRLGELYRPAVDGLRVGDLASVAWSTDGRFLFAGGRADAGTGSYPIRRWSDSGRAGFQDYPAADNTIMHLRAFGASGVLFSAGGPAFGGFDGDGRLAVSCGPATPDLRAALGRDFCVNGTGDAVRFGLDAGGGRPIAFLVPTRTLDKESLDHESWQPARLRGARIQVEGWQDGPEPTLNGKPIRVGEHEICRCLAVTADDSGFLIGTDWSLRHFDADGRLRWTRPMPGIVWGVNATADNRFAVAACDDGTIRWFRLADGEERLALFIHRKASGWVLWTAEGYYDASPGSENLIGWHVNRGAAEEADFFSVDRFRERFYRPEEVDRVFGATRPAETLRGLLPPVVTLLAPRQGEAAAGTPVTLEFEVRSPSGAPLLWLRTLADGQPLGSGPVAVPDADDRGVRSLDLAVPPGTRELGLVAETAVATSEVARLALQGAPPLTGLPVITGVPKPVLYVLVVGANGFIGGENSLRYAIKDSEDFAASMGRQVGGLYRDVQIRRVNQGAISRADVLMGMDWLRRAPTSQDVAMLFMAGHGINDYDGQYYYLPETGDVRQLRVTAVSGTDIVQVMGTTPGRRFAFLDTCNAGNVLFGASAIPRAVIDLDRLVMQLASAETGVVVFASSAPTQDSFESPAWGNGAFTKAVLEGIDQGKADATPDRGITVNELGFYVGERVRVLTNGVQAPRVLRPHTIRDFPFVLSQPVVRV